MEPSAKRADTATVVNLLTNVYYHYPLAPAGELIRSSVEEIEAREDAPMLHILWDVYNGLYGSDTFLKEVAHATHTCPECGAPGVHDPESHSMVVCSNDACGAIIDGRQPLDYTVQGKRMKEEYALDNHYAFIYRYAAPEPDVQ